MDTNLTDHQQLQFNIKLSNINKCAKLIENAENVENIKNNGNDKNNENNENNENNKNNENICEEVSPKLDIENEYGEVLPEESDANAYIKDIEQSETDTKTVTKAKPNTKNNQINNNTQLVFKISPKMKLDELQTIAKKLNILIEKDNQTPGKKKLVKTKGELIDDINRVLKN